MAHLLADMVPESPKKATLEVMNSGTPPGPTPCPLATTHPAMNFPPRPLGPPLQAAFYHQGYRGPNPPFPPRMAPYTGPPAPTNPPPSIPVNTQPVFNQYPPPFPSCYPIQAPPAPYSNPQALPQEHAAAVASKELSGSENRGRRRTRNERSRNRTLTHSADGREERAGDGEGSTRPRKKGRNRNLNASEKLVLVQECCKHAEMYQPGNKTKFWAMIKQILKDKTGYDLAFPGQTVKHWVEALLSEQVDDETWTGTQMEKHDFRAALARFADHWSKVEQEIKAAAIAMPQYVAENLEDASKRASGMIDQFSIPPLVAESLGATKEAEVPQRNRQSDPLKDPSITAVPGSRRRTIPASFMAGPRRRDNNGFQGMPNDPAVALAASIDNAGKAYIQTITGGIRQPAERDSAAVKETLFSMVDAMNARLDKFEGMLRIIMDAVSAQKGTQEPEKTEQFSPSSGQDSN